MDEKAFYVRCWTTQEIPNHIQGEPLSSQISVWLCSRSVAPKYRHQWLVPSLIKKSQGGLGMFPLWQMATSQLALTYAFPGYLGRPAMQSSTETIQFPLPWSHPYWSRSCLMNRGALVPALAVRLLGRIPKSSNMRTACSETRHRWQNKSNAIFFPSFWVSQLLDIWETGAL